MMLTSGRTADLCIWIGLGPWAGVQVSAWGLGSLLILTSVLTQKCNLAFKSKQVMFSKGGSHTPFGFNISVW